GRGGPHRLADRAARPHRGLRVGGVRPRPRALRAAAQPARPGRAQHGRRRAVRGRRRRRAVERARDGPVRRDGLRRRPRPRPRLRRRQRARDRPRRAAGAGARERRRVREARMRLADDEKAMLDGAEGPAVAAAMDLLVRYGEALGAERLCNVRNVAGTMTQPTPAKTKLVREHGWHKAFAVINLDSDGDFEIPHMRVPTCQLQHGFGEDALGVTPYPAELVRIQQDAEAFYGPRGVNILATCTPYQVGNLPVRGEHCAWME